ncbi:MAG: hypothetical protein JO142_17090 [Burkholderiales bacterium]|nr:hypothetical protein [Burkholderiales bacterium]
MWRFFRSSGQQERLDWSPQIISTTLYLMTRHALKPSSMLASLVSQHLNALGSLPTATTPPLLVMRLSSLWHVWNDMTLGYDEPERGSPIRGRVESDKDRYVMPPLQPSMPIDQDEWKAPPDVGSLFRLITSYVLAPSCKLARHVAENLSQLSQSTQMTAPSLATTARSLSSQWRTLANDALSSPHQRDMNLEKTHDAP